LLSLRTHGPYSAETHEQEAHQSEEAQAGADLEIWPTSLVNDQLIKQGKSGAPEHNYDDFPAPRPNRNLKYEGAYKAIANIGNLKRQSDPGKKNEETE
jgi:hypothetical protein